MRCSECGRLNPQMAVGMSEPKSFGTRMAIYEGYSPGGKSFRYVRDPRCMVCRHGTRSLLTKTVPAAGAALKRWLVGVNARDER